MNSSVLAYLYFTLASFLPGKNGTYIVKNNNENKNTYVNNYDCSVNVVYPDV